MTLGLSIALASLVAAAPIYPWNPTSQQTLETRFAPPEGFSRVPLVPGSFGAWLRTLPLRPEGTTPVTFDGSPARSATDPGISAVADLDVGNRDLQQCADSIIRLHAEWQWSAGHFDPISYRLTSGDPVPWARYRDGERLVVGKTIAWKRTAKPDSSHATFRRYLDLVFTYAGTTSLARDAAKVAPADLAPGDLFVQPGHDGSGHAVLVLDLARDAHGHRVALLGQGFMPAQSFQILASPTDLSRPARERAWISLDGATIDTPFWTPFPWSAAHRL